MFSIERCQQARLSLTRLEFPESCVSKLNLEKMFSGRGQAHIAAAAGPHGGQRTRYAVCARACG